MNNEKITEIVKNYLSEAGIDTDDNFLTKVWSTDFEMDDIDLNMLISEIEDACASGKEITINDESHLDALSKCTIEELISFFTSELQ